MSATEPSSPSPPSASAPRGRWDRRELLALLLFLGLSQASLALTVYVPEWWAALPALSAWGVVGWRHRWFFAPLGAFLTALALWGAELASLPGGPRDRLAWILSQALGLSTTTVYLIGPLLLAVLGAFGAITFAAALRLWDDLREEVPPTASAPSTGSP